MFNRANWNYVGPLLNEQIFSKKLEILLPLGATALSSRRNRRTSTDFNSVAHMLLPVVIKKIDYYYLCVRVDYYYVTLSKRNARGAFENTANRPRCVFRLLVIE